MYETEKQETDPLNSTDEKVVKIIKVVKGMPLGEAIEILRAAERIIKKTAIV